MLVSIAKKYNKSVVQIVLRWLIQQRVAVILKTWNFNHLKENIELFDFSLTGEKMAVIDSMDKGEFLNYKPHVALKNLPEKYKGWKGYDD